MTQGSTFPAFIQAEYDNRSGAFRDFERSAIAAGDSVKRRFEADFSKIQRIIQNALTLPPNAAGALDLDTAGLRRAADDAQATAIATRQLADAAERAALAEDNLTEASRQRVQALRAAAIASENDAREANETATAYERLQREINETTATSRQYASASAGAIASNRRMVESQSQLRQASIGAGQQLQDVAISIYSGQRAGIVFAQQLPQLSFALSGLEGSTNKTLAQIGTFASFLSGPWGLAIGLGAGALGTLVASLFETDAALQKVEFSSYRVNEAQGVLGTVMDITTGKINNQNAALQGLAQAQLLVARVQAQGRLAEARRGVTAIQDRSLILDGGFGGGINIRRRERDGRDVISQQVLSGTLDSKKAIDQLEQLRRVGRLTDEEFTSAATSVANLGLELENLKVFDSANRLLNGQGSATDRGLILKPDQKKARTGDTGRSFDAERRAAQQLDDAVTQASDAIARLRGQFDEAPRDIDRVNAASRELDTILKGIDRRVSGGKLSAEQQAREKEARRLIEDTKARVLPAFNQRPVTERIRQMDKELQVQRLILEGRADEADALTFTLDLMRQLNVDTEEQLQTELKSRGITKEKLDLMYAQHQ